MSLLKSLTCINIMINSDLLDTELWEQHSQSIKLCHQQQPFNNSEQFLSFLYSDFHQFTIQRQKRGPNWFWYMVLYLCKIGKFEGKGVEF